MLNLTEFGLTRALIVISHISYIIGESSFANYLCKVSNANYLGNHKIEKN